MDLLDACMSGLYYLWKWGDGNQALDAAFTSDSECLLLRADWWTGVWGMGDNVLYASRPIVREPMPPGDEVLHWFIPERNVDLYTPDDEFDARITTNARARTDTRRTEYLVALDQLRLSLPDTLQPAFNDWRARITARPEVTPADIAKQWETPRKVGVIHLTGPQGPADVLVVDERGEAASARGNEWAELCVDEWINANPRPEVEGYIAALAQRRLPATFSFEQPSVTVTEGTISDIALRAVRA